MRGSTPDPLDMALGELVRNRRKALKITQTELGEHLGLTFQQIQKYERGANRISFSALVRIAEVLNCSAADLVGAIENRPAGETITALSLDRETRQIAEMFSKIRSPIFRKALLDMAKAAPKD